MKIVILITATLLIIGCCGQTEPCTEGQSYNKYCNTCICTSAGSYACTLRACKNLEFACSRGLRYYDGCYTCICEKNLELGLHYACHPRKSCSHRFKPTFDHSKVKRDAPAVPSGCTRGPSYFDGCNTCVCSEGGHYACTLKYCFPDPVVKNDAQPLTKLEAVNVRRKRDEASAAKGCDKGQSYHEGCNTCVCAGDSYACTLGSCINTDPNPDTVHSRKRREIEESTGKYDPQKPANSNILKLDMERCTPNEVKNQNCNRCKCTKNGLGWLCTRKVCPQDAY